MTKFQNIIIGVFFIGLGLLTLIIILAVSGVEYNDFYKLLGWIGAILMITSGLVGSIFNTTKKEKE